jgi:hypothetical protein
MKMESEIRLCGRIVFRLPAKKLFRREKNIKMIFDLTPYRNQKVENENDMKNYICRFFLSDFALSEKNNFGYRAEQFYERSELIWNLCIANGLSSFIPTESIYKYLFHSSEKLKLKFIMFFPRINKSIFGRINISCIGRIIDDNFGDEKLIWWLKKLEVPKKIVFDILSLYPMCSKYNSKTPMNYLKVYEVIKRIDEEII